MKICVKDILVKNETRIGMSEIREMKKDEFFKGMFKEVESLKCEDERYYFLMQCVPCAAYALYKYNDIDAFIVYLGRTIHDALIFNMGDQIEDVIRKFCNIAFVDVALVEAYLGHKIV